MRFSIQKIQQFNAANMGTQNAPLSAAATVGLVDSVSQKTAISNCKGMRFRA